MADAISSEPAAVVGSVETYGAVVLTISNSVLPLDKLSPTPSSLDGMSQAVEDDLRNLGCNLIQTAGKLLKLPQVAMATGCVMFHRFFYSKSFVSYNMEHVAMGCVCLACKIEEAPRKTRDVINVFNHIKQVRQGRPIKPVILDEHYIQLKNSVIKAERRVLKELGFCVHIKHPHKLIVMYMQLLGFEQNHRFVQMSWNFMNDSLRTDIFVRYQPETIAVACIYLSARKLNIPLPRKPAWYEILSVEEDDIRDCCYRIICLYQRSKPVQEELEKLVESLKAALDEKRRVARGGVAGGAVLGTDSPSSQAPSPARTGEAGPRPGDQGEERSRSRSPERSRKKKKQRNRDRSGSEGRGGGGGRGKDRKGGKRDRSWSHSPLTKRERRRSRSRERGQHGSGRERGAGHRDHSRNYQDKYKRGERIERDHYKR